MTNDYISRQDAIDAISTWDKFGIDNRGRIVRWYEGLEPYVHLRDVVYAIERLPSAQKKGEWIQISPARIYECSRCGQNVMTDDIDCYNFCHGCGADMRGEENG